MYPTGQNREILPHLLLHGGWSQRQHARWVRTKNLHNYIHKNRSANFVSLLVLVDSFRHNFRHTTSSHSLPQMSSCQRTLVTTVSWWLGMCRYKTSKMMRCLKRLWKPWRSWASMRRKELVYNKAMTSLMTNLISYLFMLFYMTCCVSFRHV